MSQPLSTILIALGVLAFLFTLAMHLAQKNIWFVHLYRFQSLAVSLMLLLFALQENEMNLLFVAVCSLILKAIVAPAFFIRLIPRPALEMNASAYLNGPLTMLVLLGLAVLGYSERFGFFLLPFTDSSNSPALVLSGVLASLFLIINHKGALPQVTGILSLENNVVLLALTIGLTYPLPLELGILLDIVIWAAITSILMSMLDREFGSLNPPAFQELKEE